MEHKLTKEDLEILVPVIDAGIKMIGIKLFQDGGGKKLQAVVEKLQKMAEDTES